MLPLYLPHPKVSHISFFEFIGTPWLDSHLLRRLGGQGSALGTQSCTHHPSKTCGNHLHRSHTTLQAVHPPTRSRKNTPLVLWGRWVQTVRVSNRKGKHWIGWRHVGGLPLNHTCMLAHEIRYVSSSFFFVLSATVE